MLRVPLYAGLFGKSMQPGTATGTGYGYRGKKLCTGTVWQGVPVPLFGVWLA